MPHYLNNILLNLWGIKWFRVKQLKSKPSHKSLGVKVQVCLQVILDFVKLKSKVNKFESPSHVTQVHTSADDHSTEGHFTFSICFTVVCYIKSVSQRNILHSATSHRSDSQKLKVSSLMKMTAIDMSRSVSAVWDDVGISVLGWEKGSLGETFCSQWKMDAITRNAA